MKKTVLETEAILKAGVYIVDGACSMADIEISDDCDADTPIFFPGINRDYRYVTLVESQNTRGMLLPVCSKDMITWTLCYGAEVGGKIVDVYTLCTKQLERR